MQSFIADKIAYKHMKRYQEQFNYVHDAASRLISLSSKHL